MIFSRKCRQRSAAGRFQNFPYYKRAVWYELRRMPLAEYEPEQVGELCPICVWGKVFCFERSDGSIGGRAGLCDTMT